MEEWRDKTKIAFVFMIFVFFLFILFVILSATIKNEYLIIVSICLFSVSIPLFIVFCVLANNDGKNKKPRNESPHKERPYAYAAGNTNKSFEFNDRERVELEVAQSLANKFDKAVRVHYSELPLPNYCVPDSVWYRLVNYLHDEILLEDALRMSLKDMEKHLGVIEGNGSKIELGEVEKETAGNISRHGYASNVIRIGFKEEYSPSTYIAILAHELSHAYQFRQGKEIVFEGLEEEQFTDVLTMYLGFGPYTLDGKNGKGHENYEIGYVKTQVLKLAEKNVETLRKDREKQRIIDAENKKIEVEIDRIKGLLKTYVGSFQDRIYELESGKMNEVDKKSINEAVSHFDARYFKDLTSKIGYVKAKTPEENLNVLKYLEEELSRAIKTLKLLSDISK